MYKASQQIYQKKKKQKKKGTKYNINSYNKFSDQTYWLYHGYKYEWLKVDECIYPFNTLRTGIVFLYINHKSLIQSKVTFF
jgi:hypothetical protein